jgi:hypothetical protein
MHISFEASCDPVCVCALCRQILRYCSIGVSACTVIHTQRTSCVRVCIVQADTQNLQYLSICLHCDPYTTHILCACVRCAGRYSDTTVSEYLPALWSIHNAHRITWCRTLTTSKLMYIRFSFVVLTKYWTAPWGWFLYEPKHVRASVIVFFNNFIIEVLYYFLRLFEQ